MQTRNSYTWEFKGEAVRLLEQGERPAADLARELGVRRNQLYKWKEQLAQRGGEVFPGGNPGTRTKFRVLGFPGQCRIRWWD